MINKRNRISAIHRKAIPVCFNKLDNDTIFLHKNRNELLKTQGERV